MSTPCRVRRYDIMDYRDVADAMLKFTDQRTDQTDDEIWLLQHFPVFTQGTSCVQKPHSNPDRIPVVKSNRGGQITYHGPGQLIAYLLMDIKRLGLGPRSLVNKVEQGVIQLLAEYDLAGSRKHGAPGVYLNGAKVGAIGLRIRKGRCFHGLSLNVDMDLAPFHWIDPCGYPNLAITQLVDHGVHRDVHKIGDDLVKQLGELFHWELLG